MAKKKPPPVSLPETGSVYGFETQPLYPWNSSPTGRYGALKFIGVFTEQNDETPVYALLDGVFDSMPTLQQVEGLPILAQHRGALNGELSVLGVAGYKPSDLDEFTVIGSLPVSPDETALSDDCRSFGLLDGADIALEAEWRWTDDSESVKADMERDEEEEEIRQEAEDRYYEERLSGLTFETLLSETPFETWDGFRPEAFIAESREQIHALIRSLAEMGAKPKKREARGAIKTCVEWFNAADERYGGVIETSEREDICDRLYEIAFVARHPALAEEVHDWREW